MLALVMHKMPEREMLVGGLSLSERKIANRAHPQIHHQKVKWRTLFVSIEASGDINENANQGSHFFQMSNGISQNDATKRGNWELSAAIN